jgi:predicted polyphosphate/ATP-dependent NAD kinase
MQVGLIVNPIAGLGGRVGLKGTDGPDTVAQAIARGAQPQAGPRTKRALARLAQRVPGAKLHVAPGPLGMDWTEGLNCGGSGNVLKPTAAPRAIPDWLWPAMADCDLILFAGGDGTARDVAGRLRPVRRCLVSHAG